MPSTTIRPPPHEAGSDTAAPDGSRNRWPSARPFPEPTVEKIRGPRLIVLWLALIAGAWTVAGGAIYGLYALVSRFLL